jgi:glycosyltransferase involved in cell wall biosynthesis
MSLKKKKDLKQLLKIAEQRKYPKVNPSQRLSLCLITKNEEKNIARCLESVQGVVDEIIVLDTGSTDKTVEIAKNYDAKIFYSEWKNDFATARNEAIEKATGDWILILDADEELKEESKGKIRFFMVDINEPLCYTIRIKNLTNKNEIQISNFMTRLLKNHPSLRFQGKIHEAIPVSNKVMLTEEDVYILHHGYTNITKNLEKAQSRNNPIIDELLSKEDIKNEYKSYLGFYSAANKASAKEYDVAIEEYKEAISLSDLKKIDYQEFNMHLFLQLAFTYILSLRYDEGKEFLLESKNTLPSLLNTYEYWYDLGYIDLVSNKPKEALENFNKSKEIFENKEMNYFRVVHDDFYYYSTLLCIADAYCSLNNVEKTQEALDTIMEQTKGKYSNVFYYLVVASLYTFCNNLDKALEVSKFAETLADDDEVRNKILKYISNLSLRLNKFYDAIITQSKVHNKEKVKQNWYAMAKSLEDEKQFSFSEEVYAAIIEVLPEETEAYLGRCISRLIQNKTIPALEDLATAKNKASNNIDKMKVAMIYIQVSQAYQARTILDDIIKEEPENYDANLYKASLEQSEGQIQESKDRLTRMIKLYPEDTRAYLQLANLLLFNLENDEAIEVYNIVLKKEPDNAYIPYAISLCYLNKADKDKAIESLNKAIELQPENDSLIDIKNQILSV